MSRAGRRDFGVPSECKITLVNACIPLGTRTKGGVLLSVVRHVSRQWIVAVVPLSIALLPTVARAQDAAPEPASPAVESTDVPADGEPAGTSADASARDGSATNKTKATTPKYELPPPESRWKTVGLGLGFSGLWYAGAWGIKEGFWSESPGAKYLPYPIVGPWMDLGKTGCPSNDTNCGKFGLVLRTIFVVIDGVGQVGGLAVALDGLFTPTASRTDAARAASSSSAPRMNLVPVPWSSPGGGGVSFVGSF